MGLRVLYILEVCQEENGRFPVADTTDNEQGQAGERNKYMYLLDEGMGGIVSLLLSLTFHCSIALLYVSADDHVCDGELLTGRLCAGQSTAPMGWVAGRSCV